MICENTTTYNEHSFQMVPPMVQPLRLWTSRTSAVIDTVCRGSKKRRVKLPVQAFSIKGGFMNGADGERRMVIAGKIFRHQEC
jgi:hypothetical protein